MSDATRPVSSRTPGGREAAAVLLLLLFAGLPLVTRNAYYLDSAIFIILWAAMGACWNIVGGYGGLVSLGHTVFVGIGAYSSTIVYLRAGVSPWVGMLAGVALSLVLALAIGTVSFRLRGPFFALATLAIAEVGQIAATNWRPVTKGAEGLSIPFEPSLGHMIFEGKVAYLYVALGLLALVYSACLAIERSRLGYWLLAVREDEDAARAVGVRARSAKTWAYLISAGLMSLCGTVFAQYVLYIDPASVFSFDLSIQVVLLTIVGGAGHAGGPILGSLLLTPLAQGLRNWLGRSGEGLHLVVYGVLLIVIVLRVPRGLWPVLAGLRVRLRHRAARVHA